MRGPMLRVGLTGGIGSGKSTVAALFKTLQVPVIDADKIAVECTTKNTKTLDLIQQHFGASILDPNGELNRKKLREMIFQNFEEKRWLETLLHPLIIQKIQDQLNTLNAPYCILVIPLLAEIPPLPFVDRVLLVDTPEHLQIQRVMARDQLSRQAASHIVATQASRMQRLSIAHDIIHNEGSRASLEKQIEQLHHQYSSPR